MSILNNFPGGGTELEGTATPANVQKGITFMSAASDEVQTGTAVPQGTAAVAEVLASKTFMSGESETLQTGTMPNRGAVTQELSAGAAYTIPNGYHNGAGKVSAKSLASQTEATADASKILDGFTAWANGILFEGDAVLIPEGTATPATVKKGVTFMSAASENVQTGTMVPEGTATAADVVSGKTFMSAASEELQRGTRSSSTYNVNSGKFSLSGNNPPYTVNCGFYPRYLICAWGNSQAPQYMAYANFTELSMIGNYMEVSRNSSGFTISWRTDLYSGTLSWAAIG